MKRGYRVLMAEALAEIETLTPHQAAALLDDRGTTFVDLREAVEIESHGGIPGARFCPRGLLEFWVDPESPFHKPWFSSGDRFIFFCAAGWRSSLAAKTAQEMGLNAVAHIEGGYDAWKKAGLPVKP